MGRRVRGLRRLPALHGRVGRLGVEPWRGRVQLGGAGRRGRRGVPPDAPAPARVGAAARRVRHAHHRLAARGVRDRRVRGRPAGHPVARGPPAGLDGVARRVRARRGRRLAGGGLPAADRVRRGVALVDDGQPPELQRHAAGRPAAVRQPGLLRLLQQLGRLHAAEAAPLLRRLVRAARARVRGAARRARTAATAAAHHRRPARALHARRSRARAPVGVPLPHAVHPVHRVLSADAGGAARRARRFRLQPPPPAGRPRGRRAAGRQRAAGRPGRVAADPGRGRRRCRALRRGLVAGPPGPAARAARPRRARPVAGRACPARDGWGAGRARRAAPGRARSRPRLPGPAGDAAPGQRGGLRASTAATCPTAGPTRASTRSTTPRRPG